MIVAAFFAGCSVYTPPGETPTGAGGAGSTGGKDGGGDNDVGGASGSQVGGAAGVGGEAGSSGAGGSDIEDAGGVGGSGLADGSPGSRDAPGADALDGRIQLDGSTCAGSALQFGGFQYVRVNRPVQDDFTLEAWVAAMTPGVMAGTNFWEGSGLLYADALNVSNDFGTSLLGSKFAFGVGNPDTTITSVSDVMTGAWVHVAATRKKSTGEIQVFVNGTMEASRIIATQTNSLNAQPNMTIGGNVIDNRYYTGLLDEIRVWNIVRSAADIASTMHHRLTGAEPGLVGYWRLDDGSGTTAIDSSQTQPDGAGPNNGILFGPINWVASDAPICP